MALGNKLGISDSLELAHAEEKISEGKALANISKMPKSLWCCLINSYKV